MPDIVHLQVVVSVEYYAWLIQQAQRQNVSFTEVISAMLNEYRSQDRSVPIVKKPVGRYERPPKENDSDDNHDYGDEHRPKGDNDMNYCPFCNAPWPKPERQSTDPKCPTCGRAIKSWREKMQSMETKQHKLLPPTPPLTRHPVTVTGEPSKKEK